MDVGEKVSTIGWPKQALILGGGLGVLLVALVGLAVVRELVRSVPEPRHYATTWKSSDIRGALDLLETGSLDEGSADRDVESGAPEGSLSPSGLAARIRPVPDISMVRDGKEEEARRWNDETDRYAARLLEVLYEAGNMTVEEAIGRMRSLSADYHEAMIRFGRENPVFITHPDGSWGPAGNWPERREQYGEVYTAVLIQHEAWYHLSRYYAGKEWDQEIFYLRKNGVRGYAQIALRSVERIGERIGEAEKKPGEAWGLLIHGLGEKEGNQ